MKLRRRAPNRTELFSFVMHLLVYRTFSDVVQPSSICRPTMIGHRIDDPLDDGLTNSAAGVSIRRPDSISRCVPASRALQREATRADQKAFAQGEAQVADV